MADVRQRKPNASAEATVDNDDKKKQQQPTAPAPSSGYDTSTLGVALAVLTVLALTGAAIAAVLHFFDPLQYLELASSTSSSSTSSSSDNNHNHLRTFTPRTLRPYDGTDPDTPILLAINGTVYDVTAGRTFYGAPTGPYSHFAGRDATRAWITECFGDAIPSGSDAAAAEAQLTHDVRGVEAAFAPLWLDEALQDAADGLPVSDDVATLFPAAKIPAGTTLPDKLRRQARGAVERMPGGRVTGAERAERRARDAVEAREAAERALGKWVGFFAGSGGKYPVVGRMVFEEEDGKEEPPALCEKARKKRPIKGGKLEAMMGLMQKMMGGAGAGGAADAAGAGAGASQGKGQMPDFVKQMLEKREREKREKS